MRRRRLVANPAWVAPATSSGCLGGDKYGLVELTLFAGDDQRRPPDPGSITYAQRAPIAERHELWTVRPSCATGRLRGRSVGTLHIAVGAAGAQDGGNHSMEVCP
ncbi:hypothetical protein GCM10027062_23590 [Nocardioides hungaricus]